MAQITQSFIDRLNKLDFSRMYEGDFFLTWEKTDDELKAVFTIADALRAMRELLEEDHSSCAGQAAQRRAGRD